ncbi:hypothetical protein BDV97DRAFT_345004 [Delphinella strobiligena]|nr:hypothetical protein BDV97DRAFT_345004 [Delphinella strobiligena]
MYHCGPNAMERWNSSGMSIASRIHHTPHEHFSRLGRHTWSQISVAKSCESTFFRSQRTHIRY